MITPVSDPNPNDIENKDGDTTIIAGGKPDPAAAAEAARVAEAARIAAEAAKATEVVTFEPTGDVGLDMALEFIGKQGIGQDHPGFEAALQGDFTILAATFAAKGVAGWEQYVKLGEAAFSRAKEAEATAKAAREDLVHKTVGGKDEWLAIRAWAATNASAEEKADLNAQLNKGGLAAKTAAQYLAAAYNRAANVVRDPKDATGDATRGGPAKDGPNSPLSAKAYAAEVQALNTKLKGRVDGSPEYAALQARRVAFKG